MKFDRNNIVGWVIAFLLGSIVTAGGLTMTNRVRPAPIVIVPPEPTSLPEPTATPGPMQVYVNGAVAVPDVYELPPDSRVQQAIEAAGGFGVEANTTVVNLAQPLMDGAQIYVPSQNEEVAAPAVIMDSRTTSVNVSGETSILGETAMTNNDGLVNINAATLEELDTLPGIGPSTAQKILNYRDENGLFQAIEELMNVSGIGEAKFNNVKELITVGENP
ncbi:MAG: hypothetical protein GY803_01405 [Chloroflexi bacterium]|nr:hypothetical protein [Chloroflexota bacterium]